MKATNFSNFNIKQINNLINESFFNKHSEFYKKKYGTISLKISNYNNFSHLPTLSKDEILSIPTDKRTFIKKNEVSYYSMSSGTTNQKNPLLVPHENLRTEIKKVFLGNKLLKEKRPSKILILLPPKAPKFSIFLKVKIPGIQFFTGDINNLKLMIYLIDKTKIDGIMSTPTIISKLVELTTDKKEFSRIKYLHLSSEFCSEVRKKYIKKAMPRAYLYFHYGSSEIGPIGFRCQEIYEKKPTLFHINPTILAEITNHNSKTLEFGQEGNLTITSFSNAAFPLIRYQTGDKAVLYKKICGCGEKYLLQIKNNKDSFRVAGTIIYHFSIRDALSAFNKYFDEKFEIEIKDIEQEDKVMTQLIITLKAKNKSQVDLEKVSRQLETKIKVGPKKYLRNLIDANQFLPIKIKLK